MADSNVMHARPVLHVVKELDDWKMKRDAIKILLSGYWGKEGWKTPDFSADEMRLLDEAVLLRPTESLDHDGALKWALSARRGVTPASVADAFLFSLSTRDLRYRSALGSFAHLQHMPQHKQKTAEGFFSDICTVCGFDEAQGNRIDFGTLNFERHKWGGVRHDHLVYMAFDLEQFQKLPALNPTEEDRQILKQIFDAATSSKNVSALQKALGPIIKSNKAERENLCQILAYAGILQPADCPSLADAYVQWDNRGDGSPQSEMNYPLGWWAGLSYCEAGVTYWFPNL